MRTHLLSMPLDGLSRAQAVQKALQFCQQRRRPVPYAVTPNTEMILKAQKNSALRNAAEEAAIALPDSIGVLQAARILDLPLADRVPGIDFAEALLAALALGGGSVFLFGSDKGAARRAAGRLSRSFPGLHIAGVCDGYGSCDPVEAIRKADPDFVAVCLGSPKQELWMAENASRLQAGFMAGLGGSIDIWAGCRKRAPQWMRRAGLEWLGRLFMEPYRAGRMMRLPRIWMLAASEKKRNKRK
jgi:N-acetylglucosaminyldiphosphoundecaprenol N-acetyl-beta-D-mannosaminyltransferase